LSFIALVLFAAACTGGPAGGPMFPTQPAGGPQQSPTQPPQPAQGISGQVSGAATGDLQGLSVSFGCRFGQNQYVIANDAAEGLPPEAIRMRVDLVINPNDQPGVYALDDARPEAPAIGLMRVSVGGVEYSVRAGGTITLTSVPKTAPGQLTGGLQATLTTPDGAASITATLAFNFGVSALPCG
jgi:hypothetical protein